MSRWDGSGSVQLTSRPKESESTPRLSPDGHWLAFISSRGDEQEDDALWLLDRRGGEARKLPGITGSVSDIAWSPDGRTLRSSSLTRTPTARPTPPPRPPSPPRPTGRGRIADDHAQRHAATERQHKPEDKTPKPIVIDRFQFKQDIDGYRRKKRQRLWLYDLAQAAPRRLTTGDFDEALPAWSPDGKHVAFVSKRGADPDRTYDCNVFTLPPTRSAPSRTRSPPTRARTPIPTGQPAPAWSPDGREIAYLQGGPVKLIGYGVRTLAVVPAGGGKRAGPDRRASTATSPTRSGRADGRTIRVMVEDDEAERVAEVPAAGGAVQRGDRRLAQCSPPSPGAEAARWRCCSDARRARPRSTPRRRRRAPPAQPSERRLAEGGRARAHRAAPASRAATGPRSTASWSPRPAPVRPQPLPTVLFNHGGPQSQIAAELHAELADLRRRRLRRSSLPTPRGGDRPRPGLFAAAHLRRLGRPGVSRTHWPRSTMRSRAAIADPDRLVRRRLELRRHPDQLRHRQRQALQGRGQRRLDLQRPRRLRHRPVHPRLRDRAGPAVGEPRGVDDGSATRSSITSRITTPTLFMVGDKDFNVPLLNSEQMYQALRSRGVDTRLVIYPGQFHGLTRPSFLKDRMQRWLAWYHTHGDAAL